MTVDKFGMTFRWRLLNGPVAGAQTEPLRIR